MEIGDVIQYRIFSYISPNTREPQEGLIIGSRDGVLILLSKDGNIYWQMTPNSHKFVDVRTKNIHDAMENVMSSHGSLFYRLKD